MKATVLSDNIGTDALPGEWGLSIYIEYEGRRILLDTGASGLFLENAARLRLDVGAVDFAVLSHAHFDHGNGMPAFFQAAKTAKFYLQDACGENCYSGRGLFRKEYIGLPKGVLTEYADRIVPVHGRLRVCEGVSLIPHSGGGLSAVGRKNGMYLRVNGRWRPDDFAHEQSLVFETKGGLVVFNSCSHGGADRIIREAGEAFEGKHVSAYVGGFHLFRTKDAEVRALAERLKESGVRRIYTGHCTGDRAFALLKETLGDRVRQMSVGLEMDFPDGA